MKEKILIVLCLIVLTGCRLRRETPVPVPTQPFVPTATRTPFPTLTRIPTRTPIPTLTPVPTTTRMFPTSTLAVTSTPVLDASAEYEIAGCPLSFIPERVKAREGLIPGYEAGYLPNDGFYPDTITMPMYALMMQDSLDGRDTFYGVSYFKDSSVLVGTWELPKDTVVDVCSARECVKDVPVKEIGPTQRITDIGSMQLEANISLSRPVWNAIFGEFATNGPYPVSIVVKSCGPGG